jgi:uncharacterized RDD family membrane protein YckC
MNWYYAEAGEQRGPITDAELSDLAKAGAIRDSTLVWREGMANWQPYGQVKGSTAAPPTRVGEVVCWQCGKMFSQDEVILIGEGWVCAGCKPIYMQRLKEGASVPSAQEYGGFWIRFAAKFIDGLIVGVVVFVPLIIFILVLSATTARSAQGGFGASPLLDFGWTGGSAGTGAMLAQAILGQALNLLFQLILVVVRTLYSTFFLGKFGATPGKMVFKLTVVDASGAKLSYGRAFGRSCAEILSQMICAIGYIIAAFDDQKRTLHDHMCNTRVVYNR